LNNNLNQKSRVTSNKQSKVSIEGEMRAQAYPALFVSLLVKENGKKNTELGNSNTHEE
jgi:hypothetical protein